MSLRRTLDVIGAMVERASSVPLSASCMVNRAEMLSLVERARSELPVELDEAAALLVAHQDVIARAEMEAQQVVDQARDEAEVLVEDSALVATARARSEQILDAARAEAARLLREADEYCDHRLAAFEDDLDRAMAQVRRGRKRLRERSDLDSMDTLQAHGTESADEEFVDEEFVEEEFVEEQVAYDQEWAAAEEERVPVGAVAAVPAPSGPSEHRIVDVASVERASAEHAGLGHRVNLQ
jgi:cell division septum initiation protein DivIVA